jgi:protein subunit release factor A
MIKKIIFFDIVILFTQTSIYITTLEEYYKLKRDKISFKKILNKQFKDRLHKLVQKECQVLNTEMEHILSKLKDLLTVNKYYQHM